MNPFRRAFTFGTAALLSSGWLSPIAKAASATADPLEELHAGGRRIWFAGSRLTPAASALLADMSTAEVRGLDAGDYGAAELLRIAKAAQGADYESQRQVLDRSISAAALRYLRHLERGRIAPSEAGYLMPLPASPMDWVAALRDLAASSNVAAALDRYEPRYVHFALLKQALARYRALAAQAGLAPLPPLPARKLQLGDAWSGAPALRRLLVAVGDLRADASAAGEMLDADLIAALKTFQARHGLLADGVLGRDTLVALNVPLAHRVQQLLWSMERARWLPQPGTGPFILVNIPQYRLFAFAGPEDREAAMVPMNVIVGQAFPEHNTPIFAADLRYVVLRPYWDVPSSIARKELLPQLRKDPGYAAKRGFELVRGQSDGSPVVPVTADSIDELSRGKLRIRQRPGRDNALGAIKFMLPNPYNVYLHSTPAQSLFSSSRRAFSHGCVRVENPLALAGFVFGPDSAWTTERIAAEMARSDPTPVRINLAKPMQVLMVYATAIAAEDGRVLFFDDVYGHDRRLQELFARRSKNGG